jgi:hypothetical protein
VPGAWSAPIPPGVSWTRTLWVNGMRRNRTVVTAADCCSVFPKSGVFVIGGATVALTAITETGYVANSSALIGLANQVRCASAAAATHGTLSHCRAQSRRLPFSKRTSTSLLSNCMVGLRAVSLLHHSFSDKNRARFTVALMGTCIQHSHWLVCLQASCVCVCVCVCVCARARARM